ncbi:MAG: hypothetical protein ACRDHK_12825, partial [Actinomycetota bacterium]
MIRRSATRFLLLLAGEAGSLMLLHRRPIPPLGEILSSPPEDAVVGVVHLAALAVAWWLATSTLLYSVAAATRVPTLVRSIRWITVPGVRAVIDGVVATTIVASSTLTLSGSALAASAGPPTGGVAAEPAPTQAYRPRPAGQTVSPPPPVYAPRPAGRAPAAPPYRPQPSGDPAVLVPTPPEARPPTPTVADPVSARATYVIQAGDHLWSVAAHQVADHTGSSAEELTARHIGRYWLRLVALNQSHLRSGN